MSLIRFVSKLIWCSFCWLNFAYPCEAFSSNARLVVRIPVSLKHPMVQPVCAKSRNYEDDDDDDFEDDEKELEYARVRRRGRRNRYLDDEIDYRDEDYEDQRSRRSNARESDQFDYEDDEDEEDDDLFDDESDFYDGIIPNPILDQIDPDGAIERWSELGSDPKFWRDAFLLLFLLFYGLALEIDNPMTFLNANDIDYQSFY